MTPLMYAVKDNRTALIDRLIELGSDVAARNNVSISGYIHCFFEMICKFRNVMRCASHLRIPLSSVEHSAFMRCTSSQTT